jgi:hypothetical protein
MVAMKSLEKKVSGKETVTQEEFTKIGKEVIKEKNNFTAELKQAAQAEKLEGVDTFFKNMPKM